MKTLKNLRYDVVCAGGGASGVFAAVAATRCAAPVTITGAECVVKSYPAFWEDYEKLGGMIRREEKL